MTKFIVDPGSTHMNKREWVLEHVQRASDAGAWAVKFQLFNGVPLEQRSSDNVILSLDNFDAALNEGSKRGIHVTASVFTEEDFNALDSRNVPFVKFAHSKANLALSLGYRLRQYTDRNPNNFVLCSAGILNRRKLNNVPFTLKTLFCIPEYPVIYDINWVEISKLFDSGKFNGFSDHTLGIEDTICAANYGAEYIEKHLTLQHFGVDCGDNQFAISYNELSEAIHRAT